MRKVLSLFIAVVLFVSCIGCSKTSFTYTELSPEENLSSSEEEIFSSTLEEIPSTDPFVFTLDYTILPEDQLVYLENEDAVSEWKQLVQAICNGLSFVEFTDMSKYPAVSHILEKSLYADLVTLSSDGTCLFIEYSEKNSIEAITSSVTSLFTEALGTEHNSFETLISLYKTAASFEYKDNADYSLYRTLSEHSGNAEEIAAALQYMLTQAGFTSYIASYTSTTISHAWVIAEISGNLYHFDPVFESTATNGHGLSYFGMSDKTHAAALGRDIYIIGLHSLAEEHTDLCTSNTLELLFTDATQYTLDTQTHTISVCYGFDTEKQTEFHTEAFTN